MSIRPQNSTFIKTEDIVRNSGTSFYWAMRCLPEKKRVAMYGIYAFCRLVDDVADEPGEVADKVKILNQWRKEIDLLYLKKPKHAVQKPFKFKSSLPPIAQLITLY